MIYYIEMFNCGGLWMWIVRIERWQKLHVTRFLYWQILSPFPKFMTLISRWIIPQIHDLSFLEVDPLQHTLSVREMWLLLYWSVHKNCDNFLFGHARHTIYILYPHYLSIYTNKPNMTSHTSLASLPFIYLAISYDGLVYLL